MVTLPGWSGKGWKVSINVTDKGSALFVLPEFFIHRPKIKTKSISCVSYVTVKSTYFSEVIEECKPVSQSAKAAITKYH